MGHRIILNYAHGVYDMKCKHDSLFDLYYILVLIKLPRKSVPNSDVSLVMKCSVSVRVILPIPRTSK